MFVFTNQPPEPSLRGELRGAEGWDVVWNRPSSKSWVSCLVTQDWTGAAWEHTWTVANLNPGERCVLGLKNYRKLCWHLGNFWFTSIGIIEGSAWVLVPTLILVWPTSKLGEVVQGLSPLSSETSGWRYHSFHEQLFPMLNHPPPWWKFFFLFLTRISLAASVTSVPCPPVMCLCKVAVLSFSVTHRAIRQQEALLLPPIK